MNNYFAWYLNVSLNKFYLEIDLYQFQNEWFIYLYAFLFIFYTEGNEIQPCISFITECFQDAKSSGALKKSSRYRSRSLSASSTDSYSSSKKLTLMRHAKFYYLRCLQRPAPAVVPTMTTSRPEKKYKKIRPAAQISACAISISTNSVGVKLKSPSKVDYVFVLHNFLFTLKTVKK